MKAKLIFILSILFIVMTSCELSNADIEPNPMALLTPSCEIDPFNSQWRMYEMGNANQNDLNLPVGFELTLLDFNGDTKFIIDAGSDVYEDVLSYEPDLNNPNPWFTFVNGSQIFVSAFQLYGVENDTMEFRFSTPTSDPVGNIFWMVNIDCESLFEPQPDYEYNLQ